MGREGQCSASDWRYTCYVLTDGLSGSLWAINQQAVWKRQQMILNWMLVKFMHTHRLRQANTHNTHHKPASSHPRGSSGLGNRNDNGREVKIPHLHYLPPPNKLAYCKLTQASNQRDQNNSYKNEHWQQHYQQKLNFIGSMKSSHCCQINYLRERKGKIG